MDVDHPYVRVSLEQPCRRRAVGGGDVHLFVASGDSRGLEEHIRGPIDDWPQTSRRGAGRINPPLYVLLILIDQRDLADSRVLLCRWVEHAEVARGFGVVIQIDADSSSVFCHLGPAVALWAPFDDLAGHDCSEPR
ncbi:hypothetical protein D9M72_462830 [compost metagenome]